MNNFRLFVLNQLCYQIVFVYLGKGRIQTG
jgi:hypothetical protein